MNTEHATARIEALDEVIVRGSRRAYWLGLFFGLLTGACASATAWYTCRAWPALFFLPKAKP